MTASLPKDKALATAATNSDHHQVSAPNDLSRSPERPVVDTQRQSPVAAAKSTAVPQTTASLPKDKALATAATNSEHDQVSAPNDLSRSPERPVLDTQTQTPVAEAKSTAVPQTTALLPKDKALATSATNSEHDQVSAPIDSSRPPERSVVNTQTQTPVAAAKSTAVPPPGRPPSLRQARSIYFPRPLWPIRGFQRRAPLATFHLGSPTGQNRLFRASAPRRSCSEWRRPSAARPGSSAAK